MSLSMPDIARARGAAWAGARRGMLSAEQDAASAWSLLGLVAEAVDGEPMRTITDVERAAAMRELLHSAGIHHGQHDTDGLPVLPPHDMDHCRICWHRRLGEAVDAITVREVAP